MDRESEGERMRERVRETGSKLRAVFLRQARNFRSRKSFNYQKVKKKDKRNNNYV